MKQATFKNTVDILHKIEFIEKEVFELKLRVLKKITFSPKKVVSLRGVIKNVDVSDEDIRRARNSVQQSGCCLAERGWGNGKN